MIQGSLIHKGIRVPRKCYIQLFIEWIMTILFKDRHLSSVVEYILLPHSNAVWHLHGNHKMIRWHLIIHAAVDGFSCCITYIMCSNYNCANAVLEAFLEGISVFGLPEHVCSDHGGENI